MACAHAGAVIYYPVFINDVAENETFGLDFEPTPCEGCVFYNATTRCVRLPVLALPFQQRGLQCSYAGILCLTASHYQAFVDPTHLCETNLPCRPATPLRPLCRPAEQSGGECAQLCGRGHMLCHPVAPQQCSEMFGSCSAQRPLNTQSSKTTARSVIRMGLSMTLLTAAYIT